MARCTLPVIPPPPNAAVPGTGAPNRGARPKSFPTLRTNFKTPNPGQVSLRSMNSLPSQQASRKMRRPTAHPTVSWWEKCDELHTLRTTMLVSTAAHFGCVARSSIDAQGRRIQRGTRWARPTASASEDPRGGGDGHNAGAQESLNALRERQNVFEAYRGERRSSRPYILRPGELQGEVREGVAEEAGSRAVGGTFNLFSLFGQGGRTFLLGAGAIFILALCLGIGLRANSLI